MDKEKMLTLLSKIYGALNTISVSGYTNTKTLSNCMEALQKLADDIDACPIDVKQEDPRRNSNINSITPANPNRLRPE